MDSRRTTSSQRDTTARSSRDASNHSRPLDLTRQSSTSYDRSFNTRDVAGQGASGSGYDRGYNTYQAGRTTSGDYAGSRMTPEEIALDREYSRKVSANSKYSKGY